MPRRYSQEELRAMCAESDRQQAAARRLEPQAAAYLPPVSTAYPAAARADDVETVAWWLLRGLLARPPVAIRFAAELPAAEQGCYDAATRTIVLASAWWVTATPARRRAWLLHLLDHHLSGDDPPRVCHLPDRALGRGARRLERMRRDRLHLPHLGHVLAVARILSPADGAWLDSIHTPRWALAHGARCAQQEAQRPV